MLSFDKNFGKLMLESHLTYAMEDLRNAHTDADDQFYTLGIKLSYNAIDFGVGYTKETLEKKNTEKNLLDIERTHISASLSYTMNDSTVGINYGKSEFDDDEAITAGTKGGEQSQVAIGLIHKLAESVSARLIYKKEETSVKTGSLIGSRKDNSSSSIITGITASF